MTPVHPDHGSVSKRSECLPVEVKAAVLTAVSVHVGTLIQVISSVVCALSPHVSTSALAQAFATPDI